MDGNEDAKQASQLDSLTDLVNEKKGNVHAYTAT